MTFAQAMKTQEIQGAFTPALLTGAANRGKLTALTIQWIGMPATGTAPVSLELHDTNASGATHLQVDMNASGFYEWNPGGHRGVIFKGGIFVAGLGSLGVAQKVVFNYIFEDVNPEPIKEDGY